MRELRAVKIEAQRGLRAVLGLFQPAEFRFRVDETANQPRGGNPVDPGPLARRPGASAVLSFLALWNDSLCRMRLIGRKACVEGRLGVGQGALDLRPRSAGEKIDGAQCCDVATQCRRLATGFDFVEFCDPARKAIELPEELCTVRTAIEQPDE